MTALAIAHDTWILVGDGRKALVLRNEGDETFPNLETVRIFDAGPIPKTSAIGTDRPGRSVQSADGRRAGMDQTDWHELAESRFAAEVAHTLDARVEAFPRLIVVAPPRTLAELRRSFSKGLRAKIVAEVDKDLTQHPIYDIERVLTGKRKS